MPIELKDREWTSEAELLAHYRTVIARRPRVVPIMPRISVPVSESPPPTKPLNLAQRLRRDLKWPGTFLPSARIVLLHAVCESLRIDLKVMLGPNRSTWAVSGREVYVYLCRTMLRCSYPEIARTLRRDHSTVMHAFNRASEKACRDKTYAAMIESIAEDVKLAMRELKGENT